MRLAHFLALFLITHLSSLCRCFCIINSYCISPSPAARRLGLPNIVHPKTKPAFRDLKFACNGFWLFVCTCHLQFPRLPMCRSPSERKLCCFVYWDYLCLWQMTLRWVLLAGPTALIYFGLAVGLVFLNAALG